jgi:GNAT superfamily N-acetyltransferase
VAVDASRLVGTITVTPPRSESGCEYYRRAEVATLNQFAVAPEHQFHGLGSRLLEYAESWARSHGYGAVAIDTAEPASHLLSFYARRGYIHVGWVQWTGKRYRSVIMRKEL